MVAHDPLHRSGRAVLPHPAPALGHSAKSHQRIRLTDTRRGKPSIDIPLHAFPAQAIILTPAAKNPPPKAAHRPSKRADACDVHRHPIVTDVSKDHRSQIASNLRDGKMHAPLQFTLELLKLCLPPLAHRLPQHRKPSLTRLPTDMREAKKVEGLGLSLSTPLTVLCRVAAKLDQARLLWMQFQTKSGNSLRKFCQELLRFLSMLEAHDEVSSAGELHPHALAEPYVNVSAHTAPIIQPQVAPLTFASGQTTQDHDEQCLQANVRLGDDAVSASCISAWPSEQGVH
jgi:hypothetical protein